MNHKVKNKWVLVYDKETLIVVMLTLLEDNEVGTLKEVELFDTESEAMERIDELNLIYTPEQY
jgi:hypothetical protein